MQVSNPSSALLYTLMPGRNRSTAQKTSPNSSWPCTTLMPICTMRSRPFADVAWYAHIVRTKAAVKEQETSRTESSPCPLC
eukprot:scaffold86128_cov54-Phaeocystis_antarctica.AAC.2